MVSLMVCVGVKYLLTSGMRTGCRFLFSQVWGVCNKLEQTQKSVKYCFPSIATWLILNLDYLNVILVPFSLFLKLFAFESWYQCCTVFLGKLFWFKVICAVVNRERLPTIYKRNINKGYCVPLYGDSGAFACTDEVTLVVAKCFLMLWECNLINSVSSTHILISQWSSAGCLGL